MLFLYIIPITLAHQT